MSPDTEPTEQPPGVAATAARGDRRLSVLLWAIFIVATNGVIYELLIAGYSSYLLGDSISQFALTIGVFLCAMGVGSFLTRFISADSALDAFVWTEVAIGLVGGPAILLLFAAYQLQLSYVAAMLIMTGLIGALIGLEIPLVIRLAASRTTLRRAIADVLGLDYVGALAGSLIFPMVFLPNLGFTRTCLTIGLINLAVGVVTLVAFWGRLRRPRLLAAISAAAIGLLVAGIALTPWLRALVERE